MIFFHHMGKPYVHCIGDTMFVERHRCLWRKTIHVSGDMI